MAATQTQSNMPVFVANGDIARSNQKVIIAGVLVCKGSATARGGAKLVNGASTLQIIPLTVLTSAAHYMYVDFPPGAEREVVGLKATTCSGCNMIVFLK